MSQLSITTTQNVNINFNTASVGERVLAGLLDLVIKIAYYIVVFYVILGITSFDDMAQSMDRWSVMAIGLLLFLPIMFYSIVQESLLEGQTMGKKVLKIKVIKLDGYQASFSDYLIRWLFRPVEVVYIFCIIGLVTLIATKKTQRLGDIAAGTGIISLKNNININHTILREVASNYVPLYPLVIKLTDNDVRIIKETFENSYQTADFDTIERLQHKIESVTGIKSVSKNALSFVDTVLQDYNYYTQNM